MTCVYEEWHHAIFAVQYLTLVLRTIHLAETDPDNYMHHQDVKLLKKVRISIKEALQNPASALYNLGNALGEANRHWRRIKSGLPQRYRLFFQFSSAEMKVIFTWLNDQDSLRKEGSKNDVYAVFRRMLGNRIDNDFGSLLENATKGVRFS
jgi:toxin YhaV